MASSVPTPAPPAHVWFPGRRQRVRGAPRGSESSGAIIAPRLRGSCSIEVTWSAVAWESHPRRFCGRWWAARRYVLDDTRSALGASLAEPLPMKLAIAAALCTSCVVGDEPDNVLDDTTRAGRAPTTIYKRVVLGRLYQTSNWMLPAADTYRPDLPDVVDRRIAYVCDAIA